MPDDDDIDFKKAMRDVRPLVQDKHKLSAPKAKHCRPKRNAQDTHTLPPPVHAYDYDVSQMDQDRWVSGDAKVVFKRDGVQLKTIDSLRRGQYPIQARLDLHHFNASQAMALADQFIDQCRHEGLRCVLMIHGKGYMSRNDKPILKNILIEHLRKNPYVLAYHFARPRDGGTGALYVLIKAGHKG